MIDENGSSESISMYEVGEFRQYLLSYLQFFSSGVGAVPKKQSEAAVEALRQIRQQICVDNGFDPQTQWLDLCKKLDLFHPLTPEAAALYQEAKKIADEILP